MEPEGSSTLSAFQQLHLTFTAPSRAFASLRSGRTWWLPFLIIVASGLLFGSVVNSKVGWEQVYRNTLAQSSSQQAQFDKLDAGQKEQRIALGAKITHWSIYIFSIAGPLIAAAIVSGVLLASLNFLLGGHARFGPLFALWMFANMPGVIKILLASGTLFLGVSPEQFQIQNPLGSNAAFYLANSDAPKWLINLLKSVDVFTIWQVVLLTIGCALIAKLTRKQAAVVVVGWWLLMVIIGTAWTAAKG